MKSIYLAHCLGAGPDRKRNLKRAAKWLAWMADCKVIPVATWITLASVWDESRRDEGLALDFAQIARCDELWLCGPRISNGMALEKNEAHRLGIPVLDLTHHKLILPPKGALAGYYASRPTSSP